ncbi:hypothetical protein K493DRAFT_295428 [Basidiobolus meristosporus CBS 931.73]|uniref:Dilute domain-containing protein n=1 Tax=Basidiobolus meristosporus CBS 931.73 TaxID=1314790 RepID=A0A1Y1ZBJ3_9FUNG|nr:hypothetical protein K493DRAFT_295428 [Basidiobolus meristosporus CBS 931.73]|eukprot:ORY07620.1 hypothetical protein K493DRAFT_295428 [Basidiobolus meristosporus CBS 931.73]
MTHIQRSLLSLSPFDYKVNNLKYEAFRSPLSPISATFEILKAQLEDEQDIIQNSTLTRAQIVHKLTSILRRAASNGDSLKVTKLLQVARDYIEIDGSDEDGTTALIFASCFGYTSIVQTLLQNGANPNVADKIGWTPLMWATNGHQDVIVATLLKYGASMKVKSFKGRTVTDFANHSLVNENGQYQRIMEILSDSKDGASTFISNCESGYYTTTPADVESIVSNSDILKKMAMNQMRKSNSHSMNFRFSYYGDFEDSIYDFSWETIQPHQMFVFTYGALDMLLDKIIVEIQPQHSGKQKFLPANILFLAARYVIFLSDMELLEDLMAQSFQRILSVVKRDSEDISSLAFWLSNCTLLLYYLKKDSSFVTTVVEHQLNLSEMVHEIYQMFIQQVCQLIDHVLEPAMLIHEALPGMGDVKFVAERRNFLFSGKKTFTPPPTSRTNQYTSRRKAQTANRHNGNTQSIPTPKALCCVLSSTLIILHSYEVHPTIIHSTLNQLFYYISAEIFNLVLTTKEYCCRIKAMQVRMNLSVIEDWVHANRLPQILNQHFNSLVQMLQFLQCLSQLSDLMELITTTNDLHSLNHLQLYRLTINYRYEVGERPLSEEITQYLEQVAKDTCNVKIRAQNEANELGKRKPNVREENVDTMSIHGESGRLNANANIEELEELMDSTHALPFAIPTNTEMLCGWGRSGREYTPYLPDSFLEEFDRRMKLLKADD